MTTDPAIRITKLSHHYGGRTALNEISFDVAAGEIFILVGPNGGGKTTLFRVLSTLIPPQSGEIQILGCDLIRQQAEIRRSLGVVFQAPSLDRKLTVIENIRYQAILYGLTGNERAKREAELLEQLGLADRAGDLVETLSGGLKRRVELAKGMIPHPRLLLLDEPSTALDPGARSNLWEYLTRLRDETGVTIALTSHLLEEAERADHMAILDTGSIVALDTPDALRATVGGDSITMQSSDPQALASEVRQKFQVEAKVLDKNVRLELADGHAWIAKLVEAFPGRIDTITVGKPTLEDVFIAKTGHRFWQAETTS
ncbi:MAG: ABC transporter ATP-binding protein [Planctomycetaceae bacterium]|nr:ABC transporter ATP-binding protein [Planctomycetaceae bacterium]